MLSAKPSSSHLSGLFRAGATTGAPRPSRLLLRCSSQTQPMASSSGEVMSATARMLTGVRTRTFMEHVFLRVQCFLNKFKRVVAKASIARLETTSGMSRYLLSASEAEAGPGRSAGNGLL